MRQQAAIAALTFVLYLKPNPAPLTPDVTIDQTEKSISSLFFDIISLHQTCLSIS